MRERREGGEGEGRERVGREMEIFFVGVWGGEGGCELRKRWRG